MRRRHRGVRDAAAGHLEALLRAIGRDPDTDAELADTGRRVADAFVDELCSGYTTDARALLRESVIVGDAELVTVRDVFVTTTCPHHLMPATGRATVAFAPAGRIVGIGTIVAVVEAYARRLVLQEALGEDVVEALDVELRPRWVGCRLLLSHGCMVSRGERAHGARVETLALRGFAEDNLSGRLMAHQVLGVGRSE
jgi:GTP cyclohydrolase I